MSPKTVVILVVLLVFAGAAFMLTRPSTELPTDVQNPQSNDAQLIPAEALGNTLNAIDLGPDGFGRDASTSITMVRIRGQWEVNYPNPFPAETRAIDELLEQLASLEGQVTEEHYHKVPHIKPEDLVGVEGVIQADPPGIVLHNDASQAWEITLGPRLGASRAVLFIETPDGIKTTFHTTDALHDYFEVFDPDVYYAKSFDPPLMPEVGRIEITTPEGHSVLVQDKGRWWIEHEGGRERALEIGLDGYTGINNYFNLFKAAELIEKQTHYPTNGMASFGLEKPLISARFVPLGEDPGEPSNGYETHIGTPADPQDQTRYISNGYAGKATHPVFTVDTKIALAFAQDATAFRDPRIIVTPTALIDAIMLIDSKLGNADSFIKFYPDHAMLMRGVSGGGTKLGLAGVTDMLTALSNMRATEYVSLPSGDAELIRTVVIKPKLQGEAEVFDVMLDLRSDQDELTVLIRRGKEPVALRVPRSAVAGFLDPASLVAADEE
ncbi:MAG: hypothetical protein KTR15_04475 [Phycisphaeraceae bacterium]|nr:hypothetical protein [Phycisphaeraceae bacterium]